MGRCPTRKVKKRRLSHKTARRDKFEVKDILFVANVLMGFRGCSIYEVGFICFSLTYSCFLCPRDDLVYSELRKPEIEKKPLQLDEDLPGMGQFYCLHCDRYFSNVSVRDDHFKTKKHKKRVKIMKGQAPHTQLDADIAGGMGMPDNGPKLMAA